MKKRLWVLLSIALLLSGCSPGGGKLKMDDTPAGRCSEFIPYGGGYLFSTIIDGKGNLLVYDPVTGETSPFCKDATCSHGKDGCNSGYVEDLELYDGKIYGRKWLVEESEICKVLVELKDGRFQQALDGDIRDYQHAGGCLFALTRDNSLIVYEQGSRKPRMLVEEYTEPILAISGGVLYGGGFLCLSRVCLTAKEPTREVMMGRGYHGKEPTMKGNVFSCVDGDAIYYGNFDDFYLRRCNLDGSEPELLLEMAIGPGSLLPGDEDWLYFVSDDWEDHHVYRAPKADPSQAEALAELPLTPYVVYTVPGCDVLFILMRTDSGDTLTYYTMNKDGSNVREIIYPGF